ncbi:MAG TPA: BON domain-containing protein [Candidatus Acidoferrales bacterium]|nr:BON domain-containing protein [Candidatus Acidoferrales bacterium]
MRSRLVRSIVSILLVGLVLTVPMLVAQGTPSDDRIYNEVRRKLAVDADVKGAAFVVTVKNGAVKLEGRVHTEKAKEKATKITKKVKGVVSVDNELKLFGSD